MGTAGGVIRRERGTMTQGTMTAQYSYCNVHHGCIEMFGRRDLIEWYADHTVRGIKQVFGPVSEGIDT